MDRRKFIILSGLAIAGAGCSADDSSQAPEDTDSTSQATTPATTPTPTSNSDGPPRVALSAKDSDPRSPFASLDVSYGSMVGTEIPTEPPTLANEGTKWLFIEMQVTNTGSEEYQMMGAAFVIEAAGRQRSLVVTKEDWELRGRVIDPQETIRGWLVFQIPIETTEATLTALTGTSRDYALTFRRDESLGSSLPN